MTTTTHASTPPSSSPGCARTFASRPHPRRVVAQGPTRRAARDARRRAKPTSSTRSAADLGQGPGGGLRHRGRLREERHPLRARGISTSGSSPNVCTRPMATQPARAWIQRDPLGVALVIAPWNYPVQLSLAPIVGAIAAGNCAVLKPSELAPASSAALGARHRRVPRSRRDHRRGGRRRRDAGAARAAMGQDLLHRQRPRRPHRDDRGGRAPHAGHARARRQEPGRRRPHREPARRRRAASCGASTSNAGQTCIAPDYVLADAAIADELTREINDAVRAFYGLDPRLSPDYGRIIDDRHFERLVGYLADGTIAFGGAHDAPTRYLAPTALRDVADNAPSMTDEIFGPVLPIRTVASSRRRDRVRERARQAARAVRVQRRRRRRERVLAETSSGGAAVNATLFQVSVPELAVRRRRRQRHGRVPRTRELRRVQPREERPAPITSVPIPTSPTLRTPRGRNGSSASCSDRPTMEAEEWRNICPTAGTRDFPPTTTSSRSTCSATPT